MDEALPPGMDQGEQGPEWQCAACEAQSSGSGVSVGPRGLAGHA